MLQSPAFLRCINCLMLFMWPSHYSSQLMQSTLPPSCCHCPGPCHCHNHRSLHLSSRYSRQWCLSFRTNCFVARVLVIVVVKQLVVSGGPDWLGISYKIPNGQLRIQCMEGQYWEGKDCLLQQKTSWFCGSHVIVICDLWKVGKEDIDWPKNDQNKMDSYKLQATSQNGVSKEAARNSSCCFMYRRSELKVRTVGLTFDPPNAWWTNKLWSGDACWFYNHFFIFIPRSQHHDTTWFRS